MRGGSPAHLQLAHLLLLGNAVNNFMIQTNAIGRKNEHIIYASMLKDYYDLFEKHTLKEIGPVKVFQVL